VKETHESTIDTAEVWRPPLNLNAFSSRSDFSIDEKSLQEILKSIEKESVELKKYLTEERKLTRESCEILREVLKHLKTSFEITPVTLNSKEKPVKTVLNEKGELVLFYGEKRVDSKPLEEYDPEVVMAIMGMVLPKLEKTLKDYKYKVQRRTSLFEKVKAELKNLFKAFYSSELRKEES